MQTVDSRYGRSTAEGRVGRPGKGISSNISVFFRAFSPFQARGSWRLISSVTTSQKSRRSSEYLHSGIEVHEAYSHEAGGLASWLLASWLRESRNKRGSQR